MTAKLTYVLLMVAVSALSVLSAAWGETIGKTALPLDAENVRVGESTLGDLVADAVRAQFDADLALVQAGLLRSEAPALPAGEVTTEQLSKALFFPEEPVVLVELPGAKLQAALERSLSFLPQPSASLLQVSGLTVSYRASAPAGRRVTQVLVGKTPLAGQRTYRVAMPASLAKGNMGYFRIFDGAQVKQTGPSVSEALFRSVRTRGTIAIKPGERLRDLGARG